jgi:branched-subunit amino acid transport protein
MNEMIVVGGMAAVTLLIRYPMMALVSRVALPEQVVRALRFVPVAVLTAIILPAIVMPTGEAEIAPSNAYLWAGIISALIAWRTRNLLIVIVAGMTAFFIWRAVFGGA